MILRTLQINNWTVYQEKKTFNIFDEYSSWSGYKDINTFQGTQRITTPCFQKLNELENWILNFDQHQVR